MFAVGETPWHKLGTVLPAGTDLDSSAALAAAHLDWTVSLAELQTVANGHPTQAVEMAKAVRRDDTGRVLGVVGNGFRVLQNDRAFAAFDPWQRDGLIRYETAGSLRDGGRVWILARLAIADLEVGTDDKVAPYLLLAHGHDGSLAVRVKATAVRVVCANTLAMSLGESLAGVRFTHRGDVGGKADRAVASIDGIRIAAERRAERWRAMAARPAKDLDLPRFLAAVYERPLAEIIGDGRDPKTNEARKPARVLAPVTDAWDRPRGGKRATTTGTVFGLLQSVTQVLTHGAAGSERDSGSRLDSVAFGDAARLADRAEVVADVLASIGVHKSSGVTWEDLIDTSTTELRAMVGSAAKAA